MSKNKKADKEIVNEQVQEPDTKNSASKVKNAVVMNFSHDGVRYAIGENFNGSKDAEEELRKKGLIS